MIRSLPARRRGFAAARSVPRSVPLSALLLAALLTAPPPPASAQARGVDEIKAEIFALAESFRGQGDPDFSRQRRLDPLVAELLAAAPQPPAAARIDRLAGPWLQIWGPYDYRNDDRGVDPELATDDIHQVVFADGYYYNVATTRPGGDPAKARVILLRGVWRLVDGFPNMLKVRFTRFTAVPRQPLDAPIWTLAARAEADDLDGLGQFTVVPRVIVRLFFGGGGLREVYTDDDMRIAFGDDSLADREDEALYVFRRAGGGAAAR